MKLWIVITVTFKLVGFMQAQYAFKTLKVNYQADFSWELYKKLFSGFKQNTVISPYSLRKIFSCIQELTIPSDATTSALNKEFNKVLLLKQQNQLSDLIRRRYAVQWRAYQQETALNVTTVATIIGRAKMSPAFKNLPSTCAMYIRSLQAGSSKQMGRIMNAAMKNISNNLVEGFFNGSDIDQEWDFFVADSWKFEGLWKYEFDEEGTTTCNFYPRKSEKGLMRFMYLEETLKYGYFPKWNTEAVELPFHDKSQFSCVLMMPVGANIEVMINSLNHERFQEIYSNMTASKTTVRLPQFKLRAKLAAKHLLRWMGLNVPFNETVFHVIDQKKSVSLGDIIQKVEIVMSSKGELRAKPYHDRRRGNEFTAHRPFVFVVFDRNGLIPIIIGHIVNTITSKQITPESDERLCDHPPRNFY
ncbi:uncharacterized protein LOC135711125 [Ochlerotatus camptorhynchus]|uniref:uncharacterized protein LOC135711125 n=1 Tax=Ochlerotatus camptorhynchus TaxID=644619 RepID=UPI0031D50680